MVALTSARAADAAVGRARRLDLALVAVQAGAPVCGWDLGRPKHKGARGWIACSYEFNSMLQNEMPPRGGIIPAETLYLLAPPARRRKLEPASTRHWGNTV